MVPRLLNREADGSAARADKEHADPAGGSGGTGAHSEALVDELAERMLKRVEQRVVERREREQGSTGRNSGAGGSEEPRTKPPGGRTLGFIAGQ